MTPPGTLHLVGTPIGNREDLAPRARRVLAEAAVVACEDTRTARRLFSWLGLPAPELVAYHDHNADEAIPGIVERLEAGGDVALVSEAGMPAIQDPGYRLVVACRRRGIPVVPVPGPSALLLALAASGLPTDRFAFLGYAPRRGRREWWRATLARPETVVVYESPRRVPASVGAIAAADPDRPVCLARELTKVHEEFVLEDAGTLADSLGTREPLRGECVLVVGGAPDTGTARPRSWREALAAAAEGEVGRRVSARDLVDVLALAYPGERNAIYRALHEDPAEL